MPTTNPVPSNNPNDLLFNAEQFDVALNSTAASYTDRLGVARRTVKGQFDAVDAELAAKLDDAQSQINVKVDEATASAADAADSALEALGYLQTYRTTSYGAYAIDPATDPLGNPPTVGDEYFNTTSNLLKRFNGVTWQASDINTANLAAPSGSSLVGYDTGTVQDVLNTLTGPSGAASVGYTPAGTGAVPTTLQGKLSGTVISVFDFMSDAQRADAMSATPSIDCTAAVQAAVNHATLLQGRVTIEGYGLCLILGTVNFTHGEQRKPIYFGGGAYKKNNSGSMFSASVDNSGDVYFDNVYFESVSGAGTRIFSTDYIIRLHTTNCLFRNCDYVWYSGDDVSIGFAYTQSCQSFGDTVVGGNGYAFDLAGAFGCSFDKLTLEARDSGIRVRSGQGGAQKLIVTDSVLEGLSGTAIKIDASALSVQIENNYFELNTVGNIVFAPAAVASSVLIKGNVFAGGLGSYGIVWPNVCQNAVSLANHSYTIPIHGTSQITLGSVWSYFDRGENIADIDTSKVIVFGTEKYKQATVSGKTVSTTYLGQFQRLTVQEGKSVPNAVTTDYTVDFGVVIRTDDFVSIQCNTTADVRLTKFYKSGNTVVYSVRNDTGSAQTVTFTICVLKPLFSVIG